LADYRVSESANQQISERVNWQIFLQFMDSLICRSVTQLLSVCSFYAIIFYLKATNL